MPYSCPEMIKQEPYDHKADVWSFGCVMYHVAALKPPFGGSNPLTVASQIVEGRFERLETATPPGLYSRALLDAVGAMLVVDPAARPSAEAAAAMRCGVVMREADRAREECDRAREELRRERLDREFEASMERRRRDAAAAFERRGAGARDVSADEAGFSFSGGRVRDAFSLRRTTSVPAGRASFVATKDGGNRVKIAPERLRAVHDPATEMLAVMHKLAFVDRLPPSATRDARRAVAHRFAEFFFSGARSAGAVKAEAVKLMQGSPEPTPHGRGAGKEETYEDVARALEELLLEHGYYAATRAESR
jgi:NIMA (never in mitosis gene a)-related kinase